MFTDLINKHYQSLHETDIFILNFVIEHPIEIEKMGIEELAKRCATSKSSIMRLTQKLGFSGYSEFKTYLKWEEKGKIIEPNKHIYEDIASDFQNTFLQLEDSNQVAQIIQKIKHSNQILLYGTGQAQRYVAMEMQRLFMQINKHMYCISASDEFALSARSLTKQDVVIIISLSGELKKIEDVVNLLKLQKVQIISITNMHNNPLASIADYRLYAISSPLRINEQLVHNSFANFLTVIEYVFRGYLTSMREETIHEKENDRNHR